MDQVKAKEIQPEKKAEKLEPRLSGLSSVEHYQRQWEQLMEDTNKQLAKIREEENARYAKRSSTR